MAVSMLWSDNGLRAGRILVMAFVLLEVLWKGDLLGVPC